MGLLVLVLVLALVYTLKAISVLIGHDNIIAADVAMSWKPLAEYVKG